MVLSVKLDGYTLGVRFSAEIGWVLLAAEPYARQLT